MTETILAIHEFDSRDGEGYLVNTNKQVIRLVIDNTGQCCERWGYFMSDDDLTKYIGAALLDVTLADTALSVEKLKDVGLYEGYTMFVNLHTSAGLLQFTAYNEHNGYYGHYATVESIQLQHEEVL